MPKQKMGYGYLENFEKITYIGREAWRSKKNPNLVVVRAPVEEGEEDYLYGWAVKTEPTIVEKVTSFLGMGGEVPSAKEEPTLEAELLSMDPSDPRALAKLVTDGALSDLSAQIAENPDLLNQEGMFEQWMNLSLIEQGFATDPVMAATATKALGLGYLELFESGELDDPDKAEGAARAFAQQAHALMGLEEAAIEEAGAPEDELTALYEQQIKEERALQQRQFDREGVLSLIQAVPAQSRLTFMAGLMEQPGITELFFPSGGFGGEAAPTTTPAPGQSLLEQAEALGASLKGVNQ